MKKRGRRDHSIPFVFVSVLLLLWLVALVSNVAGDLIHSLLLVALVVLLIELFSGRRMTV